MTHAARYCIIRFLPYVETEEFANVGVVMFSPAARYFDFRLSNKWGRLSAFFGRLERRVFAQGVAAFQDELKRTRDMVRQMLEQGVWGQATAQQLFDDLVRPREALFRFSNVRAVMATEPELRLAELFEHYVDHNFATPEYHEKLIENKVRGMLKRAQLFQRFRRAMLGLDGLKFAVPFAELDETGRAVRVIKPLHLAQDDPVKIFDHGNHWVGRLRHLEKIGALPPALLMPVTEPPRDTERHAVFDEVRHDLENLGAVLASSNDEQALLSFAQAV